MKSIPEDLTHYDEFIEALVDCGLPFEEVIEYIRYLDSEEREE